MVVYISVPQQQNIFFSWMKRPSDESLRRIIPVQFWEFDYIQGPETNNFSEKKSDS